MKIYCVFGNLLYYLYILGRDIKNKLSLLTANQEDTKELSRFRYVMAVPKPTSDNPFITHNNKLQFSLI